MGSAPFPRWNRHHQHAGVPQLLPSRVLEGSAVLPPPILGTARGGGSRGSACCHLSEPLACFPFPRAAHHAFRG